MIRLLNNKLIQSFAQSENRKTTSSKAMNSVLTVQRLHGPHLKKIFPKQSNQALNNVTTFQNKFKLPNNIAMNFFRQMPLVFKDASIEKQQFEEKLKFIEQLTKKQKIGQIIQDIMFINKHILYHMNVKDIQKFVTLIHQFNINENSAEIIFAANPHIASKKFQIIYEEKLNHLKNYLHVSDAEALKIFTDQPFILACSGQKFKQSLHFFVENKSEFLTRQKIIQLLNLLGQIFLLGRNQLKQIVNLYLEWGVTKEELWPILIQHPLLFLNYPYQVMPKKLKMFRQFKFTVPMARLMLTKYPSILICSVSSLQNKFIFLRDRLEVPININTMEMLEYKFGTNLRPRGQLLVRSKVPFGNRTAKNFFKCSEAQFLKKIQVSKERLQEEKDKFPITKELDFLDRRCLQSYASDEKIYELSKAYYQE